MYKILRVVLLVSVMTVLISFLSVFLGGNYTVYNLVGISMKPTYEDGDMVVLNKNKTVERGDVIIFNHEDDDNMYNGTYVKRVVGLPGDKISSNDEGYMEVNGEKYINSETNGSVKLIVDNIVELPDNRYYVLGDNDDNSLDSRVYGLVDGETIVGVVTNIHIKG